MLTPTLKLTTTRSGKKFLEEGVQGSHGGMDWLEFEQFFLCLREDSPMPVDVYDAASWMAITALSEMSVARGGAVVNIPTSPTEDGLWNL